MRDVCGSILPVAADNTRFSPINYSLRSVFIGENKLSLGSQEPFRVKEIFPVDIVEYKVGRSGLFFQFFETEHRVDVGMAAMATGPRGFAGSGFTYKDQCFRPSNIVGRNDLN